MPKKFNASQFKSQMRQAQRKTQQAVNKYNSAVRKYNNEVKRYNRELNHAISNYNSAVRKHNAQVRRNRQIINREINKLKNNSSTNVQIFSSINAMQNSYGRIINYYDEGVDITPEQEIVLNLVEQEHANSLITANALENNEIPVDNTEDIAIGNKLAIVSEDLNSRWNGAVYALNPSNPDAARHFCTSCRELFTDFLELKAPDSAVFEYNPNCERTDRGNATRREKIKYMMCDLEFDDSVVDFADADISNILDLFSVLSSATHGPAGKYSFDQLSQVKKRVEQGINFLCTISV